MKSVKQLKQEIQALGRRARQEVGIYDPMEQAGHADMVSLNAIIEKIQDFEKKFHEINLVEWVKENQENIIAEYGLHSHDGFTPQELLAYFIKKEILGVE